SSTSPKRRCGTRWNCIRRSSSRVRRANIRARERALARSDTSPAKRTRRRPGAGRSRRRDPLASAPTGTDMTKAVLRVIGGSGIYDLPGLEKVRQRTIKSPWGEPSSTLRVGEIAGTSVVFLSRHDQGHRLSPSDINYRANIDVLKRAGVTDLV